MCRSVPTTTLISEVAIRASQRTSTPDRAGGCSRWLCRGIGRPISASVDPHEQRKNEPLQGLAGTGMGSR